MKKFKRIIKIILLIVVSLISTAIIVSSVHNRIGNTTIEFNLQGIGTKFVTLTYKTFSGKDRVNFGLSVNNKARFKISNSEICFARLQIHKSDSYSKANLIHFDVEQNDSIVITGILNDKFIECRAIEGSNICKQSLELRKTLLLQTVTCMRVSEC